VKAAKTAAAQAVKTYQATAPKVQTAAKRLRAAPAPQMDAAAGAYKPKKRERK